VSFSLSEGVSLESMTRIMAGQATEPDPAPEAAVEPVEVAADVEAVEDVKPVKRRRARHPAGTEGEKPGTFVANDPTTEVNEAWVEG
jgi:hypothetical protein